MTRKQRSLGLLPAEWHEQDGVMLTWPHEMTDWGPFLAAVEPVFVRIAEEVCRQERLLVVCRDQAHRTHVQDQLRAAGIDLQRVVFRISPSNDSWARDHGPITVFDQDHPHLLDFTFNGWGNKFPAALDNRINFVLQESGIFPPTVRMSHLNFVLEGGGIESDGVDTLLTTSRCLLSPQRNPQFNREQLEAMLVSFFKLPRILWLDHGYLAGDDTDSHIDTLARFVDPQTIAYVSCDDINDEHHAELAAMKAQLEGFRTAAGEPYRLIPLPLPRAIHDDEGQRLPATYANFLVINNAVLVPTYGDPQDDVALARLQEGFADREIIGIDCRPLIQQYGSLHCVTMQLPSGTMA